MTKETLYQNLLTEIDRSLLLDQPTRIYWLDNYQHLPLTAVQLFYENLLRRNSSIDTMVASGIDSDPDLSESISQKNRSAKKKAYQYLEKQDTEEENPDEFLRKNL